MPALNTIKKFSETYKTQVMIVVLLGMIMPMIDSSIVNVSLPSMMVGFGANMDEIQWVITSYMIAFATLMPLTAWFRETIGYRMTYILSLSLFTIGSLLCAISWSLPTLILARAIQAMGGGAIGPTAMAMLTEVYPPEERGKAMGFMGMGMILGPALGPSLGGYLTQYFGWRSIFTVNLPIGVLGILLALRILIPDAPEKGNARKFDIWGYLFLSIFIVGFLLGFTDGQKDGWTSPYIMGCFITSAVCLIGFLLVESQIKNRIIDLSLFRNRIFATTTAITVIRSIALFGGMFLLPMFMQRVMGFDALQSGLMMLPGSLMMGAIMPLVGRLSDRVGSRYLVLFGMICTILSMFMYVTIDTRMTIWALIFPTFVRGFGFAFLMAPLMSTMMNSIPQNKTGMAASINNIIMQTSGAVGIAMFSTVMVNRSNFHMSVTASSVSSSAIPFSETLRSLIHGFHDLGYSYAVSSQAAQGSLIRHFMSLASISSFQDTFLVAGLLGCLTIFPVFFLPTKVVYHPEHARAGQPPALME